GGREEPGEHVDQELQDVPADEEPEEGTERPEEEPERPAGVVRLRLRLRLERVGVAPGRVSVLELVPDEPVVPERLEVVARGCVAVARRAARQEVRACVLHRRPRRRDAGGEVQRDGERYEAGAARSTSSKFGTSAVS